MGLVCDIWGVGGSVSGLVAAFVRGRSRLVSAGVDAAGSTGVWNAGGIGLRSLSLSAL